MGCSVSLPSATALPGVVQSAHRHAADWQLLAGDTTSSSGPGGRLLHRWLRQLLARDATVTRIRDSRAVCLVESGDVKELDGAEPSGKEEEGEEAPGPLKWRARAVELADATLPFIPARVSVAFTQGGLEGLPPAPRRLHAALLIVDVSGFTALRRARHPYPPPYLRLTRLVPAAYPRIVVQPGAPEAPGILGGGPGILSGYRAGRSSRRTYLYGTGRVHT